MTRRGDDNDAPAAVTTANVARRDDDEIRRSNVEVRASDDEVRAPDQVDDEGLIDMPARMTMLGRRPALAARPSSPRMTMTRGADDGRDDSCVADDGADTVVERPKREDKERA